MARNTKGQFFWYCYRCSNYFTKNSFLRLIGFPIRMMYRFFIQWVLGIDIPDSTKIGKNFNVFHGQGLVINVDCIIGKNVTVRHNTTIGNAREGGGCPNIGNHVNIGANCVIIGEITIGDNSIIAAGSVVVKNVPNNVVVAGNPAKVIKQI